MLPKRTSARKAGARELIRSRAACPQDNRHVAAMTEGVVTLCPALEIDERTTHAGLDILERCAA